MVLDNKKIEAFSTQVVLDLSAGMSGVLVQIGLELGLYKAMAKLGATNAKELSGYTGTFTRYIQEWLNNQAAGGYLLYDSNEKTYTLPQEHALILADENSPFYMTPGFNVISSMWMDKDLIVKDFKEGKGIGWHQHHHSLFFGTEAFFRAGYRANLVNQWIPSLSGVKEVLEKGGKAADIGCGHGASTLLMAEHFPKSVFFGFDYHEQSIKTAKERALTTKLKNTAFEVFNAENYTEGDFDLICFFDSFHDLGNPLQALKHAKSKLSENGFIMLAEPASFDETEKNFNPVGRMFYAASTTLCVPNSNSQKGACCMGAQAGPAKVKDLAFKAGFSRVKVVQQTPVNLIFEIRK
ncbi:class I SAM-dependent methyltransferase [Flavobacterium sp.]|uniref:class I SAM-dependent methyltransferase n=1 Tax=Flavobacterium sp. TaxID=239 RepID=UPI003A95957F